MTAYVAETGRIYKLNASMAWVDTDPASDIIYLKDYGAVGDGTTDDTVAVQAAIAASANKILDIGQGLYVISPIVVNVPVSIIGHHIYGKNDVHTTGSATDYSGFVRKAGTSGVLLDMNSYGEMHYVYIAGNKAAPTTTGTGIRFPSAGSKRPYVMDHVVLADHGGTAIDIDRDQVYIASSRIVRTTGTGVEMDGIINASLLDADIYASSGAAISLTGCRYIRIINPTITQAGTDGIILTDSSQNYIKDGTIGETGARAINIGGSSGVTNNLFEGLTFRNANAQALPDVTGFTPSAEGTYPSVGVNSSGIISDGNSFYRCTFNTAHPNSTYQTAIGNRKASYAISFTSGEVNPAARMTFIDCYFAGDRTVNGPYQSFLPNKAVMINCGSEASAGNQVHYFGTAAAFGNALAVVKGISTTPTPGSYPVVWDSATQQLHAQPTAYASSFSWKPMPTKRVKYYVYETFPHAIVGTTVGSHSWSPAGIGSPAGTATTTPTTLGHPSAVRLNTSTVTPSGYTISGRADTFAIDTNERYTYSAMFRIPTVSTATDRFYSMGGFADTASAADVDGITFSTTDSTSEPAGSGNFRLKVTSNSAVTFSDAAAANVAGAWNGVTITVTTVAANMTLNGVAFPAINSPNIPTGTSRSFGIFHKVFAGSAITAARNMDIDWFEVIVEDTTQEYVPIANLQFFENMTMPWHELVAFRFSE